MRKSFLYSVLTILLLLNFKDLEGARTYQWNEAQKHVGESITVEGVIKYTKNIGNICFLNFHPNFEKYASILIFGEYFSSFPKSPEIYYYLKKVRIHGKVTSYKGKAQIKIYSPRQIEVIGEYERQENPLECKCNYPKQLEITAINIGQGDATLIASPSKIMLADAGESHWYSNADALKIDSVIRSKYGENCRCIDYVVVSHFHLDHIGYIFLPETPDELPLSVNMKPLEIGDTPYKPVGYGGLGYLVLEKGYKIGKMLVRNYRNHNPNKSPQEEGSKTFRNWRFVLESKEGKKRFHPEIVQLGKDQIQLGEIGNIPVIVDIISTDGATPSYPNGCDPSRFFGGPQFIVRGDHSTDRLPPSENDLCITIIISFGNFQIFIGGDLSGENYESEFGYRYHDMEQCLSSDPYIISNYGKRVEILRANHHGSSHSSNSEFFKMINPIATIFSVGDHNTYGHVDPIILDRARKFSKVVYLTECGDNIANKKEANSIGVIVVDGEYPKELEENEVGDQNIEIFVNMDGKRFYLQGTEYLSH